MKHYFITGATGAIGAALVPVLLEDQDISVDLLIRAKSVDHLKDRLEKLCEFWEFDLGDERKKRINGVTGDISLPKFGMAESDYATISGRCTHIIHCAGNVRMNLLLEEARKCSIDSARNVIALAEECRKNNLLEKIEFVSTVGVGGRMPGIVPETWIDIEREFHNTYEQAKAEAEDYIKTEVGKGLPITVHRPSMVVGNSQTGKIIHFQIFYYLCDFLSGKRTFGLIPDTGKTQLDTIPCDYVVNVIHWSSKTSKTIGKVLHECSGPEYSIPISNLTKMVRNIYQKKGIKIPMLFTVPIWMFKALAKVIGLLVSQRTKKSMRALPVFLDYLSENQAFENKRTRQILKNEIDFLMIENYFENLFKPVS